MKLAITDACIFIDFIELRLTSEFFKLPIEIHTSLDVYNELYPEQKEILKAYSSVGKLIIHNLSSAEKTKKYKKLNFLNHFRIMIKQLSPQQKKWQRQLEVVIMQLEILLKLKQ